MDNATFLQNIDVITNIGIVVATAFTYIFATYFKKEWSDSKKLKEAVYVRELLDTKKSLQLILNDINREDQPVFYAKIESLLNDMNSEIVSYATKQESSFQLTKILKGDFKIEVFKHTYRNWFDVLTSLIWGFICWAWWFGNTLSISIEPQLGLGEESNTISYFVAIIVTISTFLSSSYSYKKFYTSSGISAWIKKNILFGIYSMLFAIAYISVFYLIANILKP